MIVTQDKLNACSDLNGYIGTMIACSISDFVNMDLELHTKEFTNKCWQVARGDKLTQRSLIKMVKAYLAD